MPKELDISGVFIPPILPVLALALIAAWLTAYFLNKYRLARHFMFPQLVFLGFLAIYGVLFSTFLIRV